MFQVSLETRDRKVALGRSEAARQSFERRIADDREASDKTPASRAATSYASYIARVVPTPEMMLEVANAYRWQTVQSHPAHHDEETNEAFGHLTSDEIVGGRPLADWLDERDQLQQSAFTPGIVETAKRLADRQGWDAGTGSNELKQFCDLLRRARLAAIKTILAAATDEGFDLLRGSIPSSDPKAAYTISQAVSDYIAKKANKPEMIRKLPLALKAWNELIGIQLVSLIKRRDVQKFRDRLLQLPERASERFKGLTLPQAIEANLKRDEPFKPITARTAKLGYIGVLNSAVREALLSEHVDSNPFSSVEVEGWDEIPDERRAFRDYELKAIFDHPIWTGCHSALRRNTPGELIIKDHYYWPPLIAFFTGMRGSEIGALRLSDVFLPDDHPLPHFRVNGTKSRAGIREVPLHPLLIKLGFGVYVSDLRRKTHTRLFPGWKLPAAGKKNYATSPCQNNFNNQVLHKDRLGGVEGLTFHCFRHTLENQMSKINFDDAYRLRIMGHSQRGTKRNYRKPDLAEYHDQFCSRMKFDIVDLTHLMPTKRYA